MKVAEGCDYTCAFCIIPTLRGKYRSRDEDVDRRARRERLAARGVRELLLISQDTTFFGIDRGERGALARLLRRLNDVAGLDVDPPALPLPDDDHRRRARRDGRVREGLQVHRPAAAARVGRRAAAHAPAGQPATTYDKLLARIRRACPGRHAAHHLHRRLPGRDRSRTSTSCATSSARPSFDHVGVFTYSHEEGTRALRDGRRRPGGGQSRRGATPSAAAEAHRRGRGSRARSARRPVMVDGPSPESELVLTGRLEGQAPDIDSVVYFDGV